MSDQLLIPFKAKFVISINTTIKKFFQDSDSISLTDKYAPLTDKLGNMVSDGDERDFSLHFKLESFQIEVIQIKNNGKEITFSDSSNEVKTIQLDDNLNLLRYNTI